MDNQKIFSATGRRIEVIDALRGFALLGVLLTHMISHFGYYLFDGAERVPWLSGLDGFVGWLNANVLTGRFVNIFAFLFGLSFFIQMDRAAAKGVDFRRKFLWRMAVLCAIGVVNTLFFSGDILTFYAFLGVIMVALYKWRSWALMLLTLLLLCGGPRFGVALLLTPNQSAQTTEIIPSDNGIAEDNNAPQPNPAEWSADNNPARDFAEKMGSQTFADSVKMNLVFGLFGKIMFQFFATNRGFITFALFVLGLIVGRLRFFETLHLYPRRNMSLFVIFAVSLGVVNWLISLFPQNNFANFFVGGVQSYESIAMMSLQDISTVLLSATLVMGFVVLYQLPMMGKYLAVLAPYGRMGLTNYVMQSVVGAVLFAPWACGATFGTWSVTETFLLGLGVYIAQIAASALWLRYFRYGPLEWFWRSATYMKLQPLKK